jgi:hypothetical protein
LVGTKSDQNKLPQKYPLSVEQFAEQHKLPPPQHFSASSNYLQSMDIYAKIVAIASYPKMYPMRSQIWRFFQKLGAAATAATSSTATFKASKSVEPTSKKNSAPNPIASAFNKVQAVVASGVNDPDYMYLRYTVLTASCITVAFFIIKLLK